MYQKLITKIKEYDNIYIFRHQRPDGDAVFSQFAFYTFLNDNFKNKNIQMYSASSYDLMPYINVIDDNKLNGSLAIVLDTANCDRADSISFKKCSYVIKIDHHPAIDNYGDLNIINDKSAATCELLTDIFTDKDFIDFKLSKQTCEYLYAGIISDSQNFRTSNTTHNTFICASKLLSIGKFNPSALYNYVFNNSILYFNTTTKIRNMLKVKKGVGYIIARKNSLEELKISSDDIKNRVDEFSTIKGLNIWAIFAYNNKTKLYDASIRSRKAYIINTVASQYNGGGHKNAAGIKSLTLAQVNEVITKLVEIASI